MHFNGFCCFPCSFLKTHFESLFDYSNHLRVHYEINWKLFICSSGCELSLFFKQTVGSSVWEHCRSHRWKVSKYQDVPASSSGIEVLWDLSKKGEIWWGDKVVKYLQVLNEDVLAVGIIINDQLLYYETESADVEFIDDQPLWSKR